jgi:hypothetical protein
MPMRGGLSIGCVWLTVLLACSGPNDGFQSGDDDDDDSAGDDDDSSSGVDAFAITAGANPNNPFSALAEVSVDRDLQVVVEYGEGEAFDHSTPVVDAAEGDVVEVLVLGLRAGRAYQLRAVGTDGVDTWTVGPVIHQTEPLASGWPDCSVDFFADESEFDADEVLCTNGYLGGDASIYYCVDRWGEPVHSLQHPDGYPFNFTRVLSTGDWATTGSVESALLLFDDRGELQSQWPAVFFDGKTRFVHQSLDSHELIELTEGPWVGALGMLTMCLDTVGGEPVKGGGILVFDPATEEVLWDWCAHGEPGDELPIDPLLSYDRETLEQVEGDWLHLNALLHGVDPDGGQFFWLSARYQDWLVKVDVETDAVVWRAGAAGDFLLVEDLDDPSSAQLSSVEWFFHQHAPEWVERDGARVRFLIMDNGNLRAMDDGVPAPGPAYSRVLEFVIDEDTMRASLTFEHGERDPVEPGHFYVEAHGDADMLPGDGAVVFTRGLEPDMAISEIGYPGAEERWRFSCDGGSSERRLYRVNYFPSLYETTWKIDEDLRR